MEYLRDDSHSARREQLINRQRSRQCKLDCLEQPQVTLEHLVARRPDQRYQLIRCWRWMRVKGWSILR
ncbi:MAG: hypothetical protein MH252_11945 [Thermosynechococcaceae cyanobacterium MS004]|nr:hypothetical protein [Thermosynechococcaceae cyanobacterium MS004]